MASTIHIDSIESKPYAEHHNTDLEGGAASGNGDIPLKRTETGIVLEPQPTDDLADPLNWTSRRKHLVLFVVVFCSFFADYAAAGGAAAIPLQAMQWQKSSSQAYTPTAINTMLLGVGSIVAVILSAYIGRLPVLFWFTLGTCGTAAWSAAAGTYESYAVARSLNGFFANVAEAGGLMWINDIFFAHERLQAVNAWVCALILSPFLGPCISCAIMSAASWRVALWVNFGIVAIGLLLVLFAEEPFYPRHKAPQDVPRLYEMPKWTRITGWAQFQTRYTTNSFLESTVRLFRICTKPVALLVYVFYFFDYGWIVANNTTMAVVTLPLYNFGYLELAALYISPLVGGLLGFGFGHIMFPLIDRIFYQHSQDPQAERRLIPVWLVLPIQTVGFNLMGSGFEQHWSYMVVAVGWALHTFALIVTTTALSEYVAEVYPKASGYIQIPWETSWGTQLQYGVGSSIVIGSAIVLLAPVHIWGSQMREWAGPLHVKTG